MKKEKMIELAKEATNKFLDEYGAKIQVDIPDEIRSQWEQSAVDTIDFEKEKSMSEDEFFDMYYSWTKDSEGELLESLSDYYGL